MRLIATTLFTLTVSLIAGCEPPCMQRYPLPRPGGTAEVSPWTYDAMVTTGPASASPAVTDPGGTAMFYVNSTSFYVRHPAGYQGPGQPASVYISNDRGRNYEKAGTFDLQATHVPVHVDKDGEYWVRFTGPPTEVPTAPSAPQPHVVYIVDTAPPELSLTVSPPLWEDPEGRVPHIFKAGDQVEVRWQVGGSDIRKDTIRLSTGLGSSLEQAAWTEMPVRLEPTGATRLTVPAEAVAQGGLRFRLTAMDRAGNMGMKVTDVLQVAAPAPAVTPPAAAVGAPTTAAPPAPVPTDIAELAEAMPREPAAAAAPIVKDGWPLTGATLQAGQTVTMTDLPQAVAKYPVVVLQFSADNGQSWADLADVFLPDRPVDWTVPQADSSACKLRLVSINGDGAQRRAGTVIRESEVFSVVAR